MSKKKKYIPLTFLIIFSVYCSLVIGQSFDEENHLVQGKITFDYLFSLGEIDKTIRYREYYSTLYWSLLYFVTEIFPFKYQTEIGHLVNLTFSIATIFGIKNVSNELFNKKVGDIVFLILFFFPVFFGHMGINSSDIILAFGHVWIVYLILRYLKNQNVENKKKKYLIYLGLLAALSTGIQLLFLGSLLSVVVFILAEVFFFKKIINKDFSRKKLFYDIIKCFLIFYAVLILFWIDVHQNVLLEPFFILQSFFSENFKTGWPYNLINGNYYLSSNIPSLYFLINFVYKSPEYILLSYLLFLIIYLKKSIFFKKKFIFFNYKISLILVILIFPNLILLLIPFPVYDGLRLFLWVIPYFCIIPALSIYYLINNFYFTQVKIISSFMTLLVIFHLFNFFTITPYQYTYLNFLNGKSENRYKKFENDYWGTSIQELIIKANFNSNKIIKIATCGIIGDISKYFKKRPDVEYKIVSVEDADYIIMNNRVMFYDGTINCFDKFKGKDIAYVKKNGLLLSVIRKF
jgi:hypothetical protein